MLIRRPIIPGERPVVADIVVLSCAARLENLGAVQPRTRHGLSGGVASGREAVRPRLIVGGEAGLLLLSDRVILLPGSPPRPRPLRHSARDRAGGGAAPSVASRPADHGASGRAARPRSAAGDL